MKKRKWELKEARKWFPQWEKDLQASFPLWPMNKNEPEDEKDKETAKSVIAAMLEIFEAVNENTNVRAKWQKPGMYALPAYISIEYDLLDSHCGLAIGLVPESVFLSARLRYTDYLSSMDDVFWLELASLYRQGEVKLSHGCLQAPVIGKEYNARLLKDSKSVFYMLMRNHILCKQQEVDDEIFGLEAHWPRSTPLHELFPKMVLVFESLYRLEIQLRRQAYVSFHSTRKRSMKKHGITGKVPMPII